MTDDVDESRGECPVCGAGILSVEVRGPTPAERYAQPCAHHLPPGFEADDDNDGEQSEDVEARRDRLAEQAGDGGGCLETAQAAGESRSRRSVLGSALAAVVSIGAVPGVMGASDDSDHDPDLDDITVDAPPEAEQARVEARALNNDDVQAIRNEFIGDGWTPAGDRVVRTEHDEDGTEYYTVLFEFATPSDEDAVVLYDDRDDSATGLHSKHVDLSDDGENGHWELTAYTVSGGSIATETETIENFRGCSNVNWGCVLLVAGAWGSAFASCAACKGSGGALVPACAKCITLVLGSSGATITCDTCHDQP